ncbi:hypothetical protein V2H77_21165 [Photorhabdus sp. P32]|uniref:hypothetical protein n=1 Tax=Photorhabdus TaxID=29487 RepID=UPI00223DC261|nr:hypothetical protein [Photorhabdus aballayi]MCW7549855.1 hypothetical protein [Photorhabdus aballayi]
MKYKSIIYTIIYLMPFYTIGAGKLKDVCDGELILNTSISSINITSNQNGNGPAMNILVEGQWYDTYLSPGIVEGNGIYGLYDMINTAYLNGLEVNVCVRLGNLRGIELIYRP